mgnify:CR=1 FL=1
MMKMEGIITPIVTPFHRDAEQSINYEATEKLINHLIEHGVNGIFILGSNGEFHVIDEDEKIEMTKRVVEIRMLLYQSNCTSLPEGRGSRSRCTFCYHSVFSETDQREPVRSLQSCC